MGIKVPCKGCTERSVTCHCTCEKYQEYVKAGEKIREARIKDVAESSVISRKYNDISRWYYNKKGGYKKR